MRIFIVLLMAISCSSCGGGGSGGSSSNSSSGGPAEVPSLINTVSSVRLVGVADEEVTAIGTGYDGVSSPSTIFDADATFDKDFDITFLANGVDLAVDPGDEGGVDDLYMEVELDDLIDVLIVCLTIESAH